MKFKKKIIFVLRGLKTAPMPPAGARARIRCGRLSIPPLEPRALARVGSIFSVILAAFIICGCASLVKLVVGKNSFKIPQIIAHLEPSLKNNKIIVSGKIVIQNPTESSLDLEKIYLEIQNENGVILTQDTLDWKAKSVTSKQELEAPVSIHLGLAVLNNKSITVFMRTGFTYKKLGLHIPIESNVAVLHLKALKEIIVRPLYVAFSSKLDSTILGNSSIEFILGITNPLSIDLVLEDGVIRIYTLEGKDIARSKLTRTLFGGSQSNQIKDSIRIGNIWSRLIRNEIIKRNPLKFQLSGHLKIPDTDIFIPFKIESAVEIAFSLR
ncbi:MAG: hypothetical protein V1674_04135 [Candidatus Omnitrophota bacterium]